LTDSYTQSLQLRHQLQLMVKWVIVLGVILLIRVVSMIVGYVLYAKGVKLPRWLDILL
jgi:hypothetical protein